MENRLNNLAVLGIPTEFHKYPGLGHGFGPVSGTAAEGWINDAVTFWENQIKNRMLLIRETSEGIHMP